MILLLIIMLFIIASCFFIAIPLISIAAIIAFTVIFGMWLYKRSKKKYSFKKWEFIGTYCLILVGIGLFVSLFI